MSDLPLTSRQLECLRIVAGSFDMRGVMPALREIGAEMGLSSTNAVNDHLVALCRKGYLLKLPPPAGQRSFARPYQLTAKACELLGAERQAATAAPRPRATHYLQPAGYCTDCGADTFVPHTPDLCRKLAPEPSAEVAS